MNSIALDVLSITVRTHRQPRRPPGNRNGDDVPWHIHGEPLDFCESPDKSKLHEMGKRPMRLLFGCSVAALALASLSAAAVAQLAIPAIGTAPKPNLDLLVTVRTAYLDVSERTMIVNAMIFNAAEKPARNVVVECEFWVSHRQRHTVQRVLKSRPIPPRYGLQFAIDYGKPFSDPPYATTCGVVKAELD